MFYVFTWFYFAKQKILMAGDVPSLDTTSSSLNSDYTKVWLVVHLLQWFKRHDLKVLNLKGPKSGFKRKVRPEK